MENFNSLVLEPRKVLKVLLLGIAFLIFTNLIGQTHYHFGLSEKKLERIVTLVHFDSEGNLPTLFSALLLFVASIFLFSISTSERKEGRFWKRWRGLGLIFLYLGLDEAIQIHEIINAYTRSVISAHGLFYHAWVIPFIWLLIIFFLAYIPFLQRLPQQFLKLFLLSGGLFVVGGLGMEMISGYWMEAEGTDFTYSLISTLEESLEMTGIAVFIYSLLLFMAKSSMKVILVPSGRG